MVNRVNDFPDAYILVIDDNAENVRLVERVLQHVGYTNVRVITDPGLAMRSIDETEPDLVLLDLRMPIHDGYEILALMRQPNSKLRFVPVLVFTADKSGEARIKAFEAGASDFLTKPGEVEEIMLRVNNFLQLRKMHLDLQIANDGLEPVCRNGPSNFQRPEKKHSKSWPTPLSSETTLPVGTRRGSEN